MASRPKSVLFDRSTPPHIITLVLLAGLAALTMNIFVPSLPAMTVAFDTDYTIMAQAVTFYLAMSALLQLVIGPISDRYGRRAVMLGSVALFLLATLGTIFTENVQTFLIFRMAQAVIATGLVLSRAVVRDMFGADEAASMIGYVTMGMAVVPMVGPVIGGLLQEQFGWQSNFWLLFGAGVLVLWLVWVDMGETGLRSGLRFADQLREYPLLLTSPRFWGYCSTAACTTGTFFAYLGGAPLVATDVYGLSAAQTGFYFAFAALGYMAGNYLSGRLSSRIGIDRMALYGTVPPLVAVIALLVTVPLGLPGWAFFAMFALVGLGNGVCLPNAISGMLSVRPHLAGSASGLGGAIQIGGGAAFSSVAALSLGYGTAPYPILFLMLLSSAGALLSIVLVVRRNRRLAREALRAQAEAPAQAEA
ncbi:Bcr/CflA family drug resistance efflux transporter [Pacificitalea manganoxidans]|uniref:Bcr/CflA family efflux transporter n=1 Tax=Pacificitalea manganoxidans TaxID=1411902 RepID=A0A291M125_9RHOB|nr:multidrug effflux MFS transporter [Pacificitalea manganoxidans]ATI42610.1 Bcr/CflA family drug resistance efflux transporter [Pacificitalea manganoxidans]MDR6307513.1 DHA1 family bicyclomycin/chloramphenicol resistance-like MFS transporter [Pacificitalea manganoxidans]